MSLLERVQLDRGHVVLLNDEVDVNSGDAVHIFLVILVIMLLVFDIGLHTFLKLFLIISRHFLDLHFWIRVNCFLRVATERFLLGETRCLILSINLEIGWRPCIDDVLFHVLNQLEAPDSNLVVRELFIVVYRIELFRILLDLIQKREVVEHFDLGHPVLISGEDIQLFVPILLFHLVVMGKPVP